MKSRNSTFSANLYIFYAYALSASFFTTKDRRESDAIAFDLFVNITLSFFQTELLNRIANRDAFDEI